MENNNPQNIKYIKVFMVHFMLFIVSLLVLIWLGNFILSNIPWVDVIVYLWGLVLVMHAFLVFGLMGLLGDKIKLVSLRIDRMISKYTKF